MTEATDYLGEKLDAIHHDVNALDKRFATFAAEAKACKQQCDATHKVVFGNGGPGLKAKVWVMWGLLGTLASALVALAQGWIGIHRQ